MGMSKWVQADSLVLALADVEQMVPRNHAGHHWDSDEIHMSVAGQQRLGRSLAQLIPAVIDQENVRNVPSALSDSPPADQSIERRPRPVSVEKNVGHSSPVLSPVLSSRLV